jgi:hypothetical protein
LKKRKERKTERKGDGGREEKERDKQRDTYSYTKMHEDGHRGKQWETEDNITF